LRENAEPYRLCVDNSREILHTNRKRQRGFPGDHFGVAWISTPNAARQFPLSPHRETIQAGQPVDCSIRNLPALAECPSANRCYIRETHWRMARSHLELSNAEVGSP
jgi:hypothetical protein